MPIVTPKTSNPIDRNAVSADRTRRNWQRLRQSVEGGTLVAVDGTTITINTQGQLTLVAKIVINETPGEPIDGVNATFSLGNPPLDGTLLVSVDGLLMTEGADYTVAGSTFTFVTNMIPQTGDTIRVTYET